MGNDKYLLLFQDARIRFLEWLGFSERAIGDGTGVIMSEAHLNFRVELFLSDRLTVAVRPAKIGASRFVLEYEVRRDGEETAAATGTTTLAAFDYQKRRITRIPASFRRALEGCLTGGTD